MKLGNSLYICLECKKTSEKLADLLFVEDDSSRGFCSEDCIEDFYTPYIKYYDEVVTNLRIKYLIESENVHCPKDDDYLVEETSHAPSEIWCLNSELNEKIYFYLKRKETFWVLMICTRYNQAPSFVFSITKTSNLKLVNEYRVGEKIDIAVDNNLSEAEIEEEVIFLESLDNKKSNLLGELLIRRLENDIPFEDFANYETNFAETLVGPDEIYEIKDKEGDLVRHFLKSYFDENGKNIFYIIIGMKKSKEIDENRIVPILSFPTNDVNIFQEYRIGTKILSQIKN